MNYAGMLHSQSDGEKYNNWNLYDNSDSNAPMLSMRLLIFVISKRFEDFVSRSTVRLSDDLLLLRVK